MTPPPGLSGNNKSILGCVVARSRKCKMTNLKYNVPTLINDNVESFPLKNRHDISSINSRHTSANANAVNQLSYQNFKDNLIVIYVLDQIRIAIFFCYITFLLESINHCRFIFSTSPKSRTSIIFPFLTKLSPTTSNIHKPYINVIVQRINHVDVFIIMYCVFQVIITHGEQNHNNNKLEI